MPGNAGQQMFLGIQLQLNAQGVVTGASVAEKSLDSVASKANRTQKKVDTAATGMGSSMQAAMGVGAVGALALGAGNALEKKFFDPVIKKTSEFQVSMEQLRFVASATEKEYARLKDTALKTGLETQFSPMQAADAMRMLLSTGMETEKMYSSLGDVIKLVVGSMGTIELDVGAQAVAGMMAKYTHTAATAAEVTDTWANATRLTNLQMRELPIVMRSLRDAPGKLSAALHETLSVVGVLRGQLTSAQSAQAYAGFARNIAIVQGQIEKYVRRTGKSWDEVLTAIQNGTDKTFKGRVPKAVRAFAAFGVDFFDKSTNKMRKSMDIFTDFAGASAKLWDKNQKEAIVHGNALFKSQGEAVINALRSYKRFGLKGPEAIRRLNEELKNSKGAASEAAQAYEKTFAGLQKFIEGTQETIAIAMGENIVPYLHMFHLGLRSVLNVVLDFVRANPTFAKAIGIVAAAMVVLFKAVGTVLLGLAGYMLWQAMVTPALVAMGGAAGVAAMGLGAMQAALFPLIVALGAVSAAILGVWGAFKLGEIAMKSNTVFGKRFRRFVGDIKLVWQGLVEFWDGEGSIDVAKALESKGLDTFVIRLLQIKKLVGSFFKGVWAGVGSVLMPLGRVLGWIADKVSGVFQWMSNLMWFMDRQNIQDQIHQWEALGMVLGIIVGGALASVLTKMAILYTVALPKAIAKMIFFGIKSAWAAGKLIFFAFKGVFVVVKALAGMILSLTAVIAKFVLMGVRAVAAGLATVFSGLAGAAAFALHAVAVLAAVAAYTYLITKAFEWGKKIGPKVYEFLHPEEVNREKGYKITGEEASRRVAGRLAEQVETTRREGGDVGKMAIPAHLRPDLVKSGAISQEESSEMGSRSKGTTVAIAKQEFIVRDTSDAEIARVAEKVNKGISEAQTTESEGAFTE